MKHIEAVLTWIAELAIALLLIWLVVPPIGHWLAVHGWFGPSAVQRAHPVR